MANTGESTASINARADDAAWRDILPKLQQGFTLYRPIGLARYFLRSPAGELGGGSLTPARVKRLVRDRVLIECAPGEFKLTGDWLNG